MLIGPAAVAFMEAALTLKVPASTLFAPVITMLPSTTPLVVPTLPLNVTAFDVAVEAESMVIVRFLLVTEASVSTLFKNVTSSLELMMRLFLSSNWLFKVTSDPVPVTWMVKALLTKILPVPDSVKVNPWILPFRVRSLAWLRVIPPFVAFKAVRAPTVTVDPVEVRLMFLVAEVIAPTVRAPMELSNTSSVMVCAPVILIAPET